MASSVLPFVLMSSMIAFSLSQDASQPVTDAKVPSSSVAIPMTPGDEVVAAVPSSPPTPPALPASIPIPAVGQLPAIGQLPTLGQTDLSLPNLGAIPPPVIPNLLPGIPVINPSTGLLDFPNVQTGNEIPKVTLTPCICGVFLSGQFTRGGHSQPTGNAALLHEHDDAFPCNPMGTKQCTNRCLDVLVKHLPNSPTIICGSIDRDCHKERAYLWIKNCNETWTNTNLSAGREYCCKGGIPYKCPLLS